MAKARTSSFIILSAADTESPVLGIGRDGKTGYAQSLCDRTFRKKAAQVLATALVGEGIVQHVAELAAAFGWIMLQVIFAQAAHDFPVFCCEIDAFLFGLVSSLFFIPVLQIKFSINASRTGSIGIPDDFLDIRHNDLPVFE